MARKLGLGQQRALTRTLGLICYTLKNAEDGPLTAYAIHKRTHIHRNYVLKRSLNNLVREGAVKRSRITKGKRTNYYYTLNWDHKDAKMFYVKYALLFLRDDIELFQARRELEDMKLLLQLEKSIGAGAPDSYLEYIQKKYGLAKPTVV